ncbi:hypothetical protein [Roseivirga sp.]|uniref:hypothetical protein n=1 Tax=Roseivirga sp. TaxID=1964215 RepID=UPI003B8DAFF8
MEFAFFNSCSQSVENYEFQLTVWPLDSGFEDDIESKNFKIEYQPDSTAWYLVSVNIPRAGLNRFAHTFVFQDWTVAFMKDTLEIPFLALTNLGGLHLQDWVYFDCQGRVDGKHDYFDQNGFIRESGIFKDGKPLEISKYRANGILRERKVYLDENREEKTEVYDSIGFLINYEVNKYRKKKHLVLSYDSNGRKISKDIFYHSSSKSDKSVEYRFNSNGSRKGREIIKW